MSVNLNTANFSPELYKEAVNAAKDGNITSEEMVKVIQTADKGGINADERALLDGLLDKSNVDSLKSLESEHQPVGITFKNATPSKHKEMETNISVVKTNTNVNKAEALTQIKSMSPTNKAAFSQLFKKLDNSSKAGLLKLMDSGRLLKKSSKGQTVLVSIE